MNSQFLKTIGCLAIALALTACSSEENMGLEDNTPVAIQFTAGIGAQTRAVDTSWEAGDAIGISCTSTGSTNYTNMRYATTTGGTSGTFSYDGTNTGIFFQDDKDVTFSAYYPFTGTEKTDPGEITVNTSDQSKSKEFDFLFAEGVTTSLAKAANNSVPVNFNFEHKMCKLVLKIKSDASFTANDLKGATYTLKNIKVNGTFDTRTGIIQSNTDFDDLVIPKTSMSYDNNNLLTCSIIVLPMQTPSRITATINGVTYSTSNTNFRFVSGNSYEYTITIKKTGVEVSDCTITPWDTGATGAGSVEIE